MSRGGRNDRTLNSRGHHRAGQHPSEVAEEIAVAFRDGQARTETREDHVLPLQYALEGAPVHQVTLYYGDAIAQGGQPLRRTNEATPSVAPSTTSFTARAPRCSWDTLLDPRMGVPGVPDGI